MNKTIEIQVLSCDRPSELGLLIGSLLNQTYKEWNLNILDDCSGTPLQAYHFLNVLMHRCRDEGHAVNIIRNNTRLGVSKSRQKLVDFCLKETKGELFCRLDDDTIAKTDYLERLVKVIDSGYDL